MGGSGGSSSYGGTPDDVARTREQVRLDLARQQLAADLNQFLAEELTEYNDRDTEAVREKLDNIEAALAERGHDVQDLGFGGSVAKHTYVDGLSDVDVLVFLHGSHDGTPSEVLSDFAASLRSALPASQVSEVTPGHMAVTVTYRDGTEIQLLPATERGVHTVIPSADGATWKAVRPHKFTEKLTETNQRNGGGIVPVIKLAKALVGKLPDAQQVSGYHMEALAIDAFNSYNGPKDRASMLHHLLSHASVTVLRPSSDITGQSLHIDDHLGAPGSAARQAVASALSRTARVLGAARTVDEYKRIFE